MIEVAHIEKSFGTQTVLRDISFSVGDGESVAIIGRSGTGKSVLIKHLVGLLHPDAGEVRIDGENLVGLRERELLKVRQKFGMLFQGAALFDSMDVHANVAFPLRRSGVTDQAEINQRVEDVLNLVELPGVGAKMPGGGLPGLGGGMGLPPGLSGFGKKK